MVSKQFSFRLADEVVEWLEGLQLEGESLNQTTQRFIVESSKLSTASLVNLSTPVDIQELVNQKVESAIANSEQLQKLEQMITSLDERLGKLKAR